MDKKTFEAYRGCEDPVLRPLLDELVTINTNARGEDDYARITLNSSGCPFLSEGLCAIQKGLGEAFLCNMCATYPRIMNIVDDVLERSLDLACPEAARIVLLDPHPMEFDGDMGANGAVRAASLPVLRTSEDNSRKPYKYFLEIRTFLIWLLQYRAEPLWKRLVILGSFCDQLQESCSGGRPAEIPQVIDAYRDAAQRDLFAAAMNQPAQPAAHLEMMLELIIARISTDYTAPGFLDCYREFMQGLEWTSESSMRDLGTRYAAAIDNYYGPFMREHEYMLEHYLVSYVYRSLFPLGPAESQGELSVLRMTRSIRDECLILLMHYGVIQTILIGRAGFHKTALDANHVLRTIQSFAKVFEHSVPFPGHALEMLKAKGVETCAGLAMLLRC